MAKFSCRACHNYWTATHQAITLSNATHLVKDSLERASIRILSRRYHRGRRQTLKLIHQVTARVKNSVWVASHFSLRWSGVLAVDGKTIKTYDPLTKQLKGKWPEESLKAMNRKVWLCGIDYGTGDLPHYELAEEETKIDLVMYFQILKKIGYPLRVLVCDGNKDIPAAAHHVFGNQIIVQLCTRHFIENLKRHAGADVEQPTTQHVIFLIQRIIEATNLEQAGVFLEQLKQLSCCTRVERRLIDLFKRDAEKLTAHLLHPEIAIPHTSNDIENLFKQLNLRLKSIGRFNRWQHAGVYLKTWALFRRFTKFTDCRNKRKWRNGQAPIEIAGADITGIDCLRL